TGGFLVSWLKALETKIKTASDRELYDNSVHGIEKKQCPYILCVTNMLLHDIDSPDIKHANSLAKDILDYTDKDRFNVIMMNPPYGGSEKSEIMNHFPKDIRSSETADLFLTLIMYRLKRGGRAAVILPDGFLFGTDGAKLEIKSRLLQSFNLHTVIRMPATVFAPYTSITTNVLFFDYSGKTRETWFYRLDMPEGYKNFSKTSPIKREHFAPVDEWWQNRREIQDDGGTFKSRKYSASEIIDGGYNLDLCGFPTEEKIIMTPERTIKRFVAERDKLDKMIDRKIAQIMQLLKARG
ncbi:MAG: N-6 DNA methylase, partial [Synergistaceae bacterium]|nr:N-6 DNA methylase [Synergistaceae bacterium]